MQSYFKSLKFLLSFIQNSIFQPCNVLLDFQDGGFSAIIFH